MAKRRPLTQRELKTLEQQRKDETFIVISNRTKKQPISIQLRPPFGPDGKRIDFYLGEQTVPLRPGKTAKFPKSRLYDYQITNLRKAGYITVVE